jgi:hypothetical protein
MIDEKENSPLIRTEITYNETVPAIIGSRFPVWARVGISTVVSAAYFTITKTGKNAITNLFNLSGTATEIVLTGFGVIASITTGVFFYRATKTLDLSVNTIPKKIIVCVTPFAAAPFFTAGYMGSESLGFPLYLTVATAATVFVLREILVIDGAIKCPEKIKIIIDAFKTSISNKDIPNISRLLFSGLLTLGYSISLSDSIYSGTSIISQWLGAKKSIEPYICYPAMALGCLGTLPFVLYWVNLGIDQLTCGKNFKNNNTDKYSYIGLLAALPSVIGILGATTPGTGQALAKLGLFGKVVRVTSSIGFGAAINTIGFSSLFREIASNVNSRRKIFLENENNTDKNTETTTIEETLNSEKVNYRTISKS